MELIVDGAVGLGAGVVPGEGSGVAPAPPAELIGFEVVALTGTEPSKNKKEIITSHVARFNMKFPTDTSDLIDISINNTFQIRPSQRCPKACRSLKFCQALHISVGAVPFHSACFG
jgi:hypothetical protein